MPRCEECLHYDICEIMNDQYGISKVYPSQCGYYKNNADVAPSSEVEQLKRNLEQCENGYSQEMHLLRYKLANSKAEVAREIFEEVEKYFYNNEHKTGFLTYCNFFNLKKKYTEGSENAEKNTDL